MIDRKFRPGCERLETREACTAYAPALIGNNPVVRWRSVGGTPQDTALLAAVLSEAAQGTRLRFVQTPNASRSDYTVIFGTAGLPIVTSGSIRRVNGFGTAVTYTIPKGVGTNPDWIRTFAHEIGHALGLQHPGNSPSAPQIGSLTYIPDEFNRLRSHFRNLTDADFAFQFLPRPGVQEVPGTLYDSRSVMEVNPFRFVAFAGVFSDADRLALRILYL